MGTFKIGDKSELTSGAVAGTETLLCDTGVVYRKLQISTVASWMGVQAVTASGAATSIDLSLGRFVDLTLTASTAITFTNAKATDVLDEVILRITQGGVGAYEITFVADVTWDHGIALDLSTAVGAVDELYLSTIDGGTTWDAALIHVALSVPS